MVCHCSDGGPQTPAHHCTDFSFKTYAPVAFQYFRELFDIRSDDYMVCLSAACMLTCVQKRCVKIIYPNLSYSEALEKSGLVL